MQLAVTRMIPVLNQAYIDQMALNTDEGGDEQFASHDCMRGLFTMFEQLSCLLQPPFHPIVRVGGVSWHGERCKH